MYDTNRGLLLCKIYEHIVEVAIRSEGVIYNPSKTTFQKISRRSLKKIIKNTIIQYKKMILGVDNLICINCLYELVKQQLIDKKNI